MGFKDVADPTAILMAINECDSFRNPEDFLRKYGFGPATSYLLHFQERNYPPKAILGVAHKYQFPEIGPLTNSEFSGGEAYANKVLRDLGFEVIDASEKIQLFASVRRIARGSVAGLGKVPHKPLLLLVALVNHLHNQPRLCSVSDWHSKLQPLLDKALPGVKTSSNKPIWSLESEIWTVELNGTEIRPTPAGEPNLGILNQKDVLAGLTREVIETIDRFNCGEELYELVQSEFLSDLPRDLQRELQKMMMKRTTWWVNQGKTYSEERDAGIVWAPVLQKNQIAASHHSALAEMKIGDLVVHYSKGAVRAIGQVTTESLSKKNPFVRIDNEWETDGREVGVKYFELSNPVPLTSIKRIPLGEGPFNRNGGVTQGYMYRLPDYWAQDFRGQFVGQWPEGSPWVDGGHEMIHPLKQLAVDLLIDINFLAEIEELLEDKKQVIFYGPPGTGKTLTARAVANRTDACFIRVIGS
jgi:hypothetical protein